MKLFLFFLIGLFWGGSFVAIKIVVAIVPPFWAAAIRLISALFAIYITLKFMKKDLRLDPLIRNRVWISGLASIGIPFAFLFWAEKAISPGLGGILNGTSPVWTFIFGLILLRQHEPFTIKKLLGLILGLGGMFCIFGPKLSMGLGSSALLGSLAGGAMAMSYGLGAVLNRAVFLHVNKPDLKVSLFHQILVSTIFVTLLALVFEGLPKLVWFHNPEFVLATLYMGWLSTAFAFFIYFNLLRDWGALRASSIAYVLPVVAVLLDFLINKNVPAATDAIGAGIILTGLLLIQGRV